MGLSQLTSPSGNIVSVTDMKAHSRIWLQTEDATVAAYTASAIRTLQTAMGCSLLPQSWRLTLDCFPQWDYSRGFVGGDRSHLRVNEFMEIKLPKPPVVSITAFTYIDTSGNVNTMVANTNYVFSNNGTPKLLPGYGNQWPISRVYPDTVVIDYATGYAVGEVPDDIIQAIKLVAAGFYENRESSAQATQLQELPNFLSVQKLIGPYTRLKF